MLDVRYSTKFKKDFKTCIKRNYKMLLLQQAIDILRIPDTLPVKNMDHALSGNYSGYRECHIEPLKSDYKYSKPLEYRKINIQASRNLDFISISS